MGTAEGDSNCLDVMLAIQGKGQNIFAWGESGTAFQRVVDLSDQDTAFQGKGKEGLLDRSTVIKKLDQWFVHRSACSPLGPVQAPGQAVSGRKQRRRSREQSNNADGGWDALDH